MVLIRKHLSQYQHSLLQFRWVKLVLEVAGNVSFLCAKLLVYPYPLEKLRSDVIVEDRLPVVPWQQRLTFFVTALQALTLFLKAENMPRTRCDAVMLLETMFLMYFIVQCAFKIIAYGGITQYCQGFRSISLNSCELAITAASLVGFVAAMQTSQGINTYTARDPEDPAPSTPVVNVGPAPGLPVLFLARHFRVFSLVLAVPGMRKLFQDAFRCGVKSVVLVVVFCILILSLMAQQLFGGVILASLSGRIAQTPYMASFEHSLFFGWLLMSGEDILNMIVDGYHQFGTPLILYVIMGGMLLRLIVMKGCLATLIDNFEHNDHEKIERQLYCMDKAQRIKEQDERHMAVCELERAQIFRFSEFQFERAEAVETGGFNSESLDPPRLISLAFTAQHLSDDVGQKVRIELAPAVAGRGGLVLLYHLSTAPKDLQKKMPILFSKASLLERQIPILGCEILPQSQYRARNIAQPSPFGFVFRPDVNNRALASLHKVHEETLVWFNSKSRMLEWLTQLSDLGAAVALDDVLRACALMEKQSSPLDLVGFTAEDVVNDGNMQSLEMIMTKNQSTSRSNTQGGTSPLQKLKRLAVKLRRTLFPPMDITREQEGPKHNLMRQVFSSKFYEISSLLVVTACVATTSLDPPTSESIIPLSRREGVLFNAAFLGIFIFEWLAKCFTYGIRHTLTDPWEHVHLFVTLSMAADQLITVLWEHDEVARPVDNVIVCIRLTRVLRPVLIVRRLRVVKRSMDALWIAKGQIFLCFCMATLLAFVVISMYVETFSGRLHGCNFPLQPRHECTGLSFKPALTSGIGVTLQSSLREAREAAHLVPSDAGSIILVPLVWAPSEINFDDQLNAITALGVIACPFSQGWGVLAENLMCVRGQGLADFAQGSFIAAMPLMIVILLLHVVLFALLVAVMMRSMRESSGLAFETDAQRAWKATLRLIRRSSMLREIKSRQSLPIHTYTSDEIFDKIDTDSNGELSFAELGPRLKEFGLSEGDKKQLFKLLDKDSDGIVSREEFQAAWDLKMQTLRTDARSCLKTVHTGIRGKCRRVCDSRNIRLLSDFVLSINVMFVAAAGGGGQAARGWGLLTCARLIAVFLLAEQGVEMIAHPRRFKILALRLDKVMRMFHVKSWTDYLRGFC